MRALLAHPEFYKVGVSSAGDHDQRIDDLGYATTYQGPFAEDRWGSLINARLADRLQGKLLLIQGDLDEAVHISVRHLLGAEPPGYRISPADSGT